MKKLKLFVDDAQGRVLAPILLYLLGVPGILCFFAWLFFFKGK